MTEKLKRFAMAILLVNIKSGTIVIALMDQCVIII